jgi:pseudouridine synthase
MENWRSRHWSSQDQAGRLIPGQPCEGTWPTLTHRALKVRLQKFLSDAGISSRRGGEQLILQGRVVVNGQIVRELGTKVDPEEDKIRVDDRQAKIKRKIYLALNKPSGYICTRKDEAGRPTIYELLPPEWKVVSAGRLDYNTEGLIFLSNDGDFILKLTHPRYEISKVYKATVLGKITQKEVVLMERGIEDEGETLKATKVRIITANSSRSVVEMELREGKNREIRRMFESLNFPVEKLQRVKIGNIQLRELPIGKWRTLTPAEIKSLLP